MLRLSVCLPVCLSTFSVFNVSLPLSGLVFVNPDIFVLFSRCICLLLSRSPVSLVPLVGILSVSVFLLLSLYSVQLSVLFRLLCFFLPPSLSLSLSLSLSIALTLSSSSSFYSYLSLFLFSLFLFFNNTFSFSIILHQSIFF